MRQLISGFLFLVAMLTSSAAQESQAFVHELPQFGRVLIASARTGDVLAITTWFRPVSGQEPAAICHLSCIYPDGRTAAASTRCASSGSGCTYKCDAPSPITTCRK